METIESDSLTKIETPPDSARIAFAISSKDGKNYQISLGQDATQQLMRLLTARRRVHPKLPMIPTSKAIPIQGARTSRLRDLVGLELLLTQEHSIPVVFPSSLLPKLIAALQKMQEGGGEQTKH